MINSITHSSVKFTNLGDLSIAPVDYSALKFGSAVQAKRLGQMLARSLFAEHTNRFLTESVVVAPSPYNNIPNAATLVMNEMVPAMNDLIIGAGGLPVDTTTIHRKMSYSADYGFMSEDQRRRLIAGDSFYVNTEYVRDKLIVCIDDVRITGAHEYRLTEVFNERGMTNDVIFAYIAELNGPTDPRIESQINLAAITSWVDVTNMMCDPSNHLVVRPVKYLLALKSDEFDLAVTFMQAENPSRLQEVYNAALAEGYYRNPAYAANVAALKAILQSL